MRLQTATAEYLQWRKAQGFAKNTIRNDKSSLKVAADVLGDPELRDIHYADMARVMDWLCLLYTSDAADDM
jgi:hypothetical protein